MNDTNNQDREALELWYESEQHAKIRLMVDKGFTPIREFGTGEIEFQNGYLSASIRAANLFSQYLKSLSLQDKATALSQRDGAGEIDLPCAAQEAHDRLTGALSPPLTEPEDEEIERWAHEDTIKVFSPNQTDCAYYAVSRDAKVKGAKWMRSRLDTTKKE